MLYDTNASVFIAYIHYGDVIMSRGTPTKLERNKLLRSTDFCEEFGEKFSGTFCADAKTSRKQQVVQNARYYIRPATMESTRR